MVRASKISPRLSERDFLSLEIDRLIRSAQVRLEQQQIHVDELSRHGSERSNAKRRLTLMQGALKKLLDLVAERGRPGR